MKSWTVGGSETIRKSRRCQAHSSAFSTVFADCVRCAHGQLYEFVRYTLKAHVCVRAVQTNRIGKTHFSFVRRTAIVHKFIVNYLSWKMNTSSNPITNRRGINFKYIRRRLRSLIFFIYIYYVVSIYESMCVSCTVGNMKDRESEAEKRHIPMFIDMHSMCSWRSVYSVYVSFTTRSEILNLCVRCLALIIPIHYNLFIDNSFNNRYCCPQFEFAIVIIIIDFKQSFWKRMQTPIGGLSNGCRLGEIPLNEYGFSIPLSSDVELMKMIIFILP